MSQTVCSVQTAATIAKYLAEGRQLELLNYDHTRTTVGTAMPIGAPRNITLSRTPGV